MRHPCSLCDAALVGRKIIYIDEHKREIAGHIDSQFHRDWLAVEAKWLRQSLQRAFLHHVDRILVNAGGDRNFALRASECFARGALRQS